MATAAPTYAECTALFVEVIELWNDFHTNMTSGATAWATQQDVIEQALEGQYASNCRSVINSYRGQLSGILAGFREAADPIIFEIGRAISSNETSVEGILDDWHDYMITNSSDFNSRNRTFGDPSADGGNTGNGDVYRMTKDEDNLDIEGGPGGEWGGALDSTTLKWKCVNAENTGGEEGNAVFEVFSEGTVPDDGLFPRTAHPITQTALCRTADDSIDGFQNPDFSTYSSGGGTEKFSGWVASVAANHTQDTSNVFRADRAGTSSALKLQTGSVNVQQTLGTNVTLDPNTPYGLVVHWNRSVGSGSGTLTIRMGATNTSVVASAQSGWQVLEIVESDMDGTWPTNFNEDDMDISIEWTHTSGTVLIDTVWFGPLDGPYAGHGYYHIKTGATEPLLEDFFSASDSETGAICEEWIDRGYGRHLPHVNDGSETISDP